MGEGYINGARVLGHGPARRIPAPTDQDEVGASLAAVQQQIVNCGQSLAGLVEPAGQALISEAINRLGQQVFRIAVVGQIKSGKSSFINAFARQPRLLPTDVTPWTTTVTNLHFGERNPASNAASFQFFSTEEWRDLANGDRRIRELTRRLDPGFEPDVLHRHVEAMKQRAVMRLGADFAELLGSVHSFESFNTELLARYVCSGDFAGNSPLGQFADITKQADLYFDEGPFAFPVTLTDTPGTNDPFLIRDEITRRSLESADLYIVVLTARQPLAEADVNLMRLMHGLNSERIVVFVNRVDDFADVRSDLAEVLMYVEMKLQANFPGVRIPVVAGSAAWANCGLGADDDSLRRLMQRPSLGYLSDIGLAQPRDLTPDALNDAESRERLRGALFAASGLPTMYRAVAHYMGSSQAAHVQMQTARWFGDMANASAKAANFELESSRAAIPSMGARAADERVALERETAVLNEVAVNMERSAKNIDLQFSAIIGEEMTELRCALRAVVDAHAAKERGVLIATLEAGRAPRTWTLEGVALRRALAAEFKDCFDGAAARVLELQGKVAPELARLMSLIAPEIAMPAEPEKRLLLIPPPSMAALSRFVALDIEDSWWSSLWKGRTSAGVYGEQIESLIKTEFQPVADELVDTAERVLSTYAMTSSNWSFGLCVNIIQAVTRRRVQLLGQRGSDVQGPAARHDKLTPERKLQTQALADRQKRCGALNHQFGIIVHDLGTRLQRQTEMAP
jgi:signal recognition particle receptor subunit beta